MVSGAEIEDTLIFAYNIFASMASLFRQVFEKESCVTCRKMPSTAVSHDVTLRESI